METDKGKNPFEEIETHEEIPDTVKKKVMASVKLSHLFKDFADLFSIKMAGTAVELFNPEKKEPQKSDPDKKEQS